MITMEMIAIGALLVLTISVSFMITQGLYYWGRVTQIGQKIERLAEQYEMAHNAAVSYLKSGDIEAYDNADKLLRLYEERIEELNKELWVYIEKSRNPKW